MMFTLHGSGVREWQFSPNEEDSLTESGEYAKMIENYLPCVHTDVAGSEGI
jgi:hypothetical protein